jgi:hypothetical protein
MRDDELRITDLSGLTPENFKLRNTRFLIDSDLHYDVQAHESVQELRHDIWVVRNGDIKRVLEDFPRDEPLLDQCADWMHAVVGKHFFPDANHRTALALLRSLLVENGIKPGRWSPERTREARDESHDVRKRLEPVRIDTLYERDELWEVWRSYFEDVFEPRPLQN